jgi:hypothetical protein
VLAGVQVVDPPQIDLVLRHSGGIDAFGGVEPVALLEMPVSSARWKASPTGITPAKFGLDCALSASAARRSPVMPAVLLMA